MKGNNIRVTTGRSGSHMDREFIVKSGETFYPGMIVQEDRSVAEVEGVSTAKIFNADADGGRPKGAIYVVSEILQVEQGRGLDPTVSANGIAAGERCICHVPAAGEQFNVIYKNETGTADDVAAGDMLINDDTTGKVTLTTGSPETECWMAMEAIVDPTADQLLWVQYTGY